MFVPALADLTKDAELSGAPTRVYLFLLGALDPVDYRAVKAWAIAEQLRMKSHTVGRALAILAEKGYLHIGEHNSDGTRTFRIVYSRDRGGLSPERHRSTA